MNFNKLISPHTKNKLIVDFENNIVYSEKTSEKYIINNGVIQLLDKTDQFYEGAYLATTKYVPKFDFLPFNIPLLFINSGYIWNVRKTFKKNDLIVELGCGGGVNYFSERFKMIGLDLSLKSLQNAPYTIKIQGDANLLPFADDSIDGIISCSFWEHISPKDKSVMLNEFNRVLKKSGKIVFFYDVETENMLINRMKKFDPNLYKKIFIEKDGHLGYQTPKENSNLFISHNFKILKHFGLERSTFLAPSALLKLSENSYLSKFGKRFTKLFYKSSFFSITYNFILYLIDNTFGRMHPLKKSRVVISILQKK